MQLQNEKIIRIIIPCTPNFGHQKAAIDIMISLKKRNFNGVLDILYEDISQPQGIMNKWHNGTILEKLIDGFVKDTNPNSVPQVLNHPTLGRCQITKRNGFLVNLEPVNVTISSANDNAIPISSQDAKNSIDNPIHYHKNYTKIYSTRIFIQAQPTKWPRLRFVQFEDGKITVLDNNLRLDSCKADLTNYTVSSKIEKQILEIVKSPYINSQLIYGISQAIATTSEKIILMAKIFRTHFALLENFPERNSVLVMPREINVLRYAFRNGDFTRLNYYQFTKAELEKIVLIDLTDNQTFDFQSIKGKIIIYGTGMLSREVFEDLILTWTNLPPIVEGVNTEALLESEGCPFLKLSSSYIFKTPTQLSLYEEVNLDMQNLHKETEKTLKEKDIFRIGPLITYMEKALMKEPELQKYHLQRQKAFLSKGELIDTALEIAEKRSQLNISTNQSSMVNNTDFSKLKISNYHIEKEPQKFTFTDATYSSSNTEKKMTRCLSVNSSFSL